MAKKKHDNKPPGFISDLVARIREHRVQMFAAAVAFFGFVAFIPALVATVSIVGLVTDTEKLVAEANEALEAAPDNTRAFVVGQLQSIADSDGAGVGFAAAGGIVLALFSASSAVGNLMSALNVVFERDESRKWVVKRLAAMGLLLGSILVIAATVGVMAVLPELLDDWDVHPAFRAGVTIARFAGLAVLMAAGLSVLYRVGPAAKPTSTYELIPGGKRDLISAGAVVGTILFVLLSWGFGVFVRNFGSYNETYGTLAGIIIVLIWLQLAALAVLIGAEIDAVREHRRVEESRIAAGLSRSRAER